MRISIARTAESYQERIDSLFAEISDRLSCIREYTESNLDYLVAMQNLLGQRNCSEPDFDACERIDLLVEKHRELSDLMDTFDK